MSKSSPASVSFAISEKLRGANSKIKIWIRIAINIETKAVLKSVFEEPNGFFSNVFCMLFQKYFERAENPAEFIF